MLFRDLEGTKLVSSRHAALLAGLPPWWPAAWPTTLWRQARHVLTEAAAEHGRPPELRAMLAGVPLPAKGYDQPFAVIGVDDWAPPWPRPGVRDEAVTIAGQLCTPRDVLARRVRAGRMRLYGSGTWWRSGWPGRTPGTSHTTGSSCIRPLRSITYHGHDQS